MAPRALLPRIMAAMVLIMSQAHAASEAASLPPLRLLPSSYECPDSAVPAGAKATFYRACTFHNLYLWQGMAYYVVDGANESPPFTQMGMRFELWMDLEGPDAVLEIVQAIRAGDLLELLESTSPSGQAPSVVDEEIPLAYFWKARKVGPIDLDHNCDTTPASKPGKANYYHFLGEWMPALSYTLCEQYGHCSYADRTQLQIIDVNKRFRCHERELHPPFYHAAISCLSNKPFHHINGTHLRSQLTLVRTGWLGLGPRCRGVPPGCYVRRSGRLSPTVELTAMWRRIAGQCFALDPEAQAPLQPLQLLVVDRLYASGRHMLNVNTIVRALQSRYSPEHVQVKLAYMEGLSLQQQARLWGSASVVLHMHGAALANYFFLPKNAVTIQLGPWLETYDPLLYTKLLQRDLAGVSDVETLEWQNRDPSRAHLITEQVEASLWRKPELRRFLGNRERYGEFMATLRCPEGKMSGEERKACKSLQLHLNIHLDLVVAFNLTDTAIARAFEKQGRAVPPQLLAGAAAGSSRARSSGSSGGRATGEELGGGGPAAAAAAGGGAAARQSMLFVGSSGLWAQLRSPGGTQLLLLGLLLGSLAAALMLSFVQRPK